MAKPLLAFRRAHSSVEHPDVRCSGFGVRLRLRGAFGSERCSVFQFAAHHSPIAPDILEQVNKRAAFRWQRECDNDHFASVSATITEIFSAELPAAISPFTSLTPGRGERTLLKSAALFAGIST